MAPSASRRRRASARAAAGGGSRKGRRAGSASPQPRQVRSRLDKSASRISGGSWAGKRVEGGFFPQAVGGAGALAGGAAGALGDGGAGGALGDEAGEADAAIVARAAGEAAVDHRRDMVEGDAGLGDGGREDELAGAGSGRGEGGALGGGIDLAVEAVKDDVGRQGSKRIGGALDLGHAGKEGEDRGVGLGQRAAAGGGDLRLDPRRGVAAEVDEGQRVRAAFGADQRRVAEQRAEPLAVESGAHREEAEVGAQRFGGIEGEGEREVAVEAAFVDLVEQDRRDARQFGIGLEPREIDAVGHGDEAGALADAAVEAGLVADGVARLLTERAGDELGRGAGGEAAGDEQQNLAAAPRLIEQRGRDDGGLAGARRSDEQGARAVAQGGQQVGQDVVNR